MFDRKFTTELPYLGEISRRKVKKFFQVKNFIVRFTTYLGEISRRKVKKFFQVTNFIVRFTTYVEEISQRKVKIFCSSEEF